MDLFVNLAIENLDRQRECHMGVNFPQLGGHEGSLFLQKKDEDRIRHCMESARFYRRVSTTCTTVCTAWARTGNKFPVRNSRNNSQEITTLKAQCSFGKLRTACDKVLVRTMFICFFETSTSS